MAQGLQIDLAFEDIVNSSSVLSNVSTVLHSKFTVAKSIYLARTVSSLQGCERQIEGAHGKAQAGGKTKWNGKPASFRMELCS